MCPEPKLVMETAHAPPCTVDCSVAMPIERFQADMEPVSNPSENIGLAAAAR